MGGIPWWLSDKESACIAGAAGDMGSIPGLGRSPGGGHDNPLQYSCLENPRDRGAWWATIHWLSQSWTQLKRQRAARTAWWGRQHGGRWEASAGGAAAVSDDLVMRLCRTKGKASVWYFILAQKALNRGVPGPNLHFKDHSDHCTET